MEISHQIFLVVKHYLICNILTSNLATKINLILQNIFNMVISHQICLVAKYYLICNVLATDLATKINLIL